MLPWSGSPLVKPFWCSQWPAHGVRLRRASSFSRKEKVTWVNLVKQNSLFLQLLKTREKVLNSARTCFRNTKTWCASYVYGWKWEKVNDACHKLYCQFQRAEKQLTSTSDALLQHMKSTAYEAVHLKSSGVGKTAVPFHDRHGWKKESGKLKIDWLSQPYTPPQIAEFTVWKCQKTRCQGGQCSCLSAGLPCTSAYACANCSNCEQAARKPIDSDSGSSSNGSENESIIA